MMSRRAATRKFQVSQIRGLLSQRGIYIRAASRDGIVEEAPDAYKDIEDVVRVAHGSGISRMIARMSPLGVVKG